MSFQSTLSFRAPNLSASSSYFRPLPSMQNALVEDGIPAGIKGQDILTDDSRCRDPKMTPSENDGSNNSDKHNEIRVQVNGIRSMLKSMDDGEISTSAYDTAWVAMVEDVNGGGRPQFPSCSAVDRRQLAPRWLLM